MQTQLSTVTISKAAFRQQSDLKTKIIRLKPHKESLQARIKIRKDKSIA